MLEKIIVNDQLSLGWFQNFDKEAILRYLNDLELYRNTLRIPHPYTEKDADEWLVFVREAREKWGQEVNWAIRHREAGLVGGIGRFMSTGEAGHADEIGYWLAAPFRGRGWMTEVVQGYVDWLFAHTPLVRVTANVFPHNPASARVLEKAGFAREGFARKLHVKNGQYMDAIQLARIKE